MRILLLGASGFIGSAILARLATSGHDLVGVGRQRAIEAAGSKYVSADIGRLNKPESWLPWLIGVDAVINCAGALQSSPGERIEDVHVHAIAALFAACEQASVRRVIHFSAIGVDRETPSEFSRTKLRGDDILAATLLNWVILRPSVVVGSSAYGGSALLRGLAALPVLPLMRTAGDLQLVHLDDVVDTVVFFLRDDAPSRIAVELVGPRRFSFAGAVRLFRQWLRLKPAHEIQIPEWCAVPIYKLGDLAGFLGWRPPIRTTALQEIRRGAVGDAAAWRAATGIEPRNIETFLSQTPASVQERWFARLYLLKPLIFAVFGFFWIATGIISLGPGWGYGMGLLREGGLEPSFAAVTIIAGAVSDLLIGLAILYRPTSRYGLYAALAISFTYAIIGTILVPRLWADPLGPMLKIWPVIVLNLTALAVLEDR